MVSDEQSVQISAAFLKEAARHFVCLSYWTQQQGAGPAKQHFASCFVIQVENAWFLVTAGHVIRGIESAIAAGIKHHSFSLNDQLARASGATRQFNLPYYFDHNEWVVVEGDPEGTDYAAGILRPIFAAGLLAGGVKAIEERAWGLESPASYAPWLLLGVPAESHESSNGVNTVKLTLLPLKRATAPQGATVESRTFARIVSASGDTAVVDDIAGMSGGPIFGIRVVEQSIKYWIIGIQSSWFRASRIVSFCEVSHFFLSIKGALRVAAAQITSESSP